MGLELYPQLALEPALLLRLPSHTLWAVSTQLSLLEGQTSAPSGVHCSVVQCSRQPHTVALAGSHQMPISSRTGTCLVTRSRCSLLYRNENEQSPTVRPGKAESQK